MHWNAFPVDSERIVQIYPEVIDYMMTLSKQKRGNWAEYIYAEQDVHEPSEPLVEGFSADGTYTDATAVPNVFRGGIAKGKIYE